MIRCWVAKWQTRLGVDDWLVILKFENGVTVGDDDKRVFARIHRSQYYEQATMTIDIGVTDPSTLPESIDRDLLEDPIHALLYAESQVVHELLHLVLRDVMEASDMVRDHVSGPIAAMWDEAFRRAEEATVDRLAIKLVRNWPDDGWDVAQMQLQNFSGENVTTGQARPTTNTEGGTHVS